MIKNDRRYAECIENIPCGEAGGVNMDAALDYLIAKGEAKVNKLGLLLAEAGRTGDFLRSLSDRDFQHKLFVEFGLEEKR